MEQPKIIKIKIFDNFDYLGKFQPGYRGKTPEISG